MQTFAIVFLSVILLMCLALTFWAWWRIKSASKPIDPSKPLTISYGEERQLGEYFGGSIPDVRPRLRALRVHLRRDIRRFGFLFFIICVNQTVS